MRIVKTEIIYFSENEARAFAEVARVLEGVMREASNPSIVMKAECLLHHLDNFIYEFCVDDSEMKKEIFS